MLQNVLSFLRNSCDSLTPEPWAKTYLASTFSRKFSIPPAPLPRPVQKSPAYKQALPFNKRDLDATQTDSVYLYAFGLLSLSPPIDS
ncbi:hypothetical protein I79_021639 [Cricetulus griseus]|uniref:Uncharacterized protein n=1 Tax=Cricetulus griseus TaxID=10029 RepID=G3ID66_CRIGR|nr:hypothetical protein I79_021639 [Cricetulus griseus]